MRYCAEQAGYIRHLFAGTVGWATLVLGAGRETKQDAIDCGVGIEAHASVGDQVERGEKLMTIHANDEAKLRRSLDILDAAVEFSDTHVDPLPLFYGMIDGNDV